MLDGGTMLFCIQYLLLYTGGVCGIVEVLVYSLSICMVTGSVYVFVHVSGQNPLEDKIPPGQNPPG